MLILHIYSIYCIQIQISVYSLLTLQYLTFISPTCLNIKSTEMHPFWRFSLVLYSFNALLWIVVHGQLFSDKNKLGMSKMDLGAVQCHPQKIFYITFFDNPTLLRNN